MWVGTRTVWNRITSPFDFWTRTLSCFLVVSCFLFAEATLPASAQTSIATLHNFGLTPDGDGPTGPLVTAADGSFVGTTEFGGANGTGCVYDITTSGTETVLYSFTATDATTATNNDGAFPYYGVTLGADGNYYGCTLLGGANGFGTVYMLTPTGAFSTVYTFSDTDGAIPIGVVESSTAGTFYGVTEAGGTNDDGTIFKMVVTSGLGAVTTLYSFSATSGSTDTNTDGALPVATPIIGTDGNLYGTTLGGGNAGAGLSDDSDNVGGTIWTYTLATTTGSSTTSGFQVLHTFSALDASALTNTDGSGPVGGLTQIIGGTLVGTCENGGTNGTGTVFDISTDGTTFTTLHSFDALTSTLSTSFFNTGGVAPYAGVVQTSDGTIYGTCRDGGTAGQGTIYEIATPTATPTFSVVYTFGSQSTSAADGSFSEGQLILGGDGNLYGTASEGGAYAGSNGSSFGGIFFEVPLNPPTLDPGLTVTNLSTTSVLAGSAGFTLTVTGTKFDTTSVVNWQLSGSATVALATTYVSATQLTAVVPASLLSIDATLYAGSSETHNISVVNTNASTNAKTTSAATASSTFTVNPSISLPPVISQITPGSINAGSGATSIVIAGSNIYSGDTVSINGTPLTPTQIGPTDIVVTVPASLLTSARTLSVTVSSSAGPSNALSLKVAPVTTYSAGLQFISVPFDYPGVALSTIFGYSNPKLAVWNTATSAYAITPTAPANAVRLGRGYWVRFPANTGVVISGTPATVGTPFTISLLKGWNMIGDPFLTTVEGTGITVVDSSNTSYTFSDAANANIINSSTYYYDASTNHYLSQGTGEMVPYVGYWIYASAPCTLLLNGS